MIKIQGLEQLSRELTAASAALESLDGEVGEVQFDPRDPASLEAAIVQTNAMVDAKLGPDTGNRVVETLRLQIKERFREQLLARAASARLDGGHAA